MKNPCRIGKTDMKTRRLMEGNREERNGTERRKRSKEAEL